MSYLLPRAGYLRTFLYCVQGKGKGVGSPLENKEVHRPSFQTELAQETDKGRWFLFLIKCSVGCSTLL